MNLITRSLVPLAFIAQAGPADAQDPRFLEWSIGMSTPQLQSGASVNLKNLLKPGKYLGGHAPLTFGTGSITVGIDLKWRDSPGGYADIRFEIENPGMTTPKSGPISFAHKVAIKVGSSGYLKQGDNRITTIDMVFSVQPAYEWQVITYAPLAEGINRNHKVALLNTKKRAFLVYQSRRIGFELGWWIYRPQLPVQVNTTSPGSPYYGYKSNHGEILPFLENLDKINKSETRFLRNFFGIKRYPG